MIEFAVAKKIKCNDAIAGICQIHIASPKPRGRTALGINCGKRSVSVGFINRNLTGAGSIVQKMVLLTAAIVIKRNGKQSHCRCFIETLCCYHKTLMNGELV